MQKIRAVSRPTKSKAKARTKSIGGMSVRMKRIVDTNPRKGVLAITQAVEVVESSKKNTPRAIRRK